MTPFKIISACVVLLCLVGCGKSEISDAPPPKPKVTLYSAQRVRCVLGGDKPDLVFEPAYHVTVYRNSVDFYYQGVDITISPIKACNSGVVNGYPSVSFQYNSETQLNDFIPDTSASNHATQSAFTIILGRDPTAADLKYYANIDPVMIYTYIGNSPEASKNWANNPNSKFYNSPQQAASELAHQNR